MIETPVDEKRRIVPRWRDFARTVRSGELSSIGRPGRQRDPGKDFYEKVRDWERERCIETAVELVSGAIVADQFGIAQNAAEFILKHENIVTNFQLRLAKQIIIGKIHDIKGKGISLCVRGYKMR